MPVTPMGLDVCLEYEIIIILLKTKKEILSLCLFGSQLRHSRSEWLYFNMERYVKLKNNF